MKKCLPNSKFLTIVFAMMLMASAANALNRFSVAPGPWGSTATWSATSGGAPGASVPGAADVVTIENFTVTVGADALPILTLNVSSTGTLVIGGFNFSVTGTTTLNGTLTSNSTTGAKTFDNMIINSGGVFNSTANETYTMTGSLAVNGTGSITSGTGVWTFNGTSTLGGTGSATIINADFGSDYTNSGNYTFTNLNMPNTGGGTNVYTNNGQTTVTNGLTGEGFMQGTTGVLNFSGASITVGFFDATATGNIVNYNGAAQSILATTYSNLTVTGGAADIKTIASDFTINGTLTITSNAVLTAPVGGSDDITLGGNWVNNGTFNSGDDVVTFSGATQTIGGSSTTTFNNLNISSSVSTTLLLNAAVIGNLTITAGDVFDLSTFTCNRTAAGGTLTVAGTMRLGADAGGQTGSNFPTNFVPSLTGTVEYDGANSITQTIYAVPVYENIILTNSTGSGVANKSMTGDITMNGVLTVNANTVLTPGATNRFLAGATNTITGTGTVKVTRIAATPDYNSQFDFDTDDLDQLTVDYAGAGAQTINGFTYGSLLTSNSGTKTMGAVATVNNNVTVGSGTKLDEAGIVLSVSSATIDINGTLDFSNTAGSITSAGGGTNTVTMGASGIIRTVDAVGIGPVANSSFIPTAGTITFANLSTVGTVEYYGGAGVVTDRDYNNLTITTAGTKTWTLTAARTINNTLTINAAAPLTLAGTFQVSVLGGGIAWLNDGTFAPGTSTIRFAGTAAQTIDGANATTFTNLIVANAAGLTIAQDVFMNGAMTFTSGIVTTTVADILTFNSNAAATALTPSNTSHVDGPVRKLGNLPATFSFPTGDAGQYEYIEIAGGSATNDFTAQYLRTSATALGTTFTSPVKNVSACDHWTLDQNAGTNTLTVKLSWSDQFPCGGSTPFVTDPSKLTVAHLSGSTWNEAGNPGGSTTFSGNAISGYVSRSNVSVFSPFSLGNTTEFVNPLPVLFGDVKAFEKGTGVQIEWTNLTEKDVVNYSVERSVNGRDFISISQLGARSNISDAQSYLSFDGAPSATNFYRIKVIEANGHIVYSKLMKVDIGKSPKGLVLYPNPVVGNDLSIGFTAAKGQYNLSVVNAAGQQIYIQKINHAGGTVSQAITLPATIKAGVYNMMISGDNYKETKMFVIQ